MKIDGQKIAKQLDGQKLRKACVRLSLSTNTGIDYFESLNPFELAEIAEEVKEALSNGKKK